MAKNIRMLQLLRADMWVCFGFLNKSVSNEIYKTNKQCNCGELDKQFIPKSNNEIYCAFMDVTPGCDTFPTRMNQGIHIGHIYCLYQGWGTSGLRAVCGPRDSLNRPAKQFKSDRDSI